MLSRFLPGRTLVLSLLVGVGATSVAAAQQYNNTWASFSEAPGLMGVSPNQISNNSNEVDFGWGDVDQDGDTDLVVARKQPFTTSGKRSNILLRNDAGVLNDGTDMVTDSDVAGDMGFLTPTNDRDVVLADLDNDGALEIITAPTVSEGFPKHISHPRVYMNKGGVGADWNGYRFENARTPQFVYFATGQPRTPRFCSVDGGDVTGDGFVDLYFGDYDSSEESFQSQQAPNSDLNDRLLVNDGNAFFADESLARMTSQMLFSNFGNAVEIDDFNLNGFNDILKGTSLQDPLYVSIAYNNPGNVGQFSIFHTFHSGFEPYFTTTGDLNNDGRPDVVVSDDSQDRIRINTGVDALGRATWSSGLLFTYLPGSGDQGFSGNNLVADLDNDGWDDVIVTDVDVDIPGCGRHTKIFHNHTTQVGASTAGTFRLLEERESQSSNGWIGAVGLHVSDLTGGHDVAVFDVEGDGDNDIILGRCSGTFLWTNDLIGGPPPPPGCGATQYGPNTGANIAQISSSVVPTAGQSFTFSLSGFSGSGNALMVLAMQEKTTIAFGGTLLVDFATNIYGPGQFTTIPVTNGSGDLTLTIPPGAGNVTVFAQAALLDASMPSGYALTNGLRVTVCP